MKEFSKRSNGFTLVELLIVVAILGILISIIVVAIREYSQRAKNTKILSDVSQVKRIAESIYMSQSDGYVNLCQADNLNENDQDLKILKEDIEKQGGSITCKSIEESYCLSVSLVGGSYLCLDDEGDSGIYQTNPCSSANSVCP
jgi:prepilin-type N-terminal cleavage/methylation domain-containing protein